MRPVVTQSRVVGLAAPRYFAQATKTTPPTRKRTPAIKNGGIVATPRRIAKQVDPQIT